MSRASHREHAGLLACRQTFFDLFPGCWIRDFFLQESTSVLQRLNPISVCDSQIGLGCRSLRAFCRSRDALTQLGVSLHDCDVDCGCQIQIVFGGAKIARLSCQVQVEFRCEGGDGAFRDFRDFILWVFYGYFFTIRICS